MKAVTIKILKDELKYKSQSELMELCLHLSRFKKENKELLTYLLFESQDEENYIEGIKEQMDVLFDEINTNSYFYIRKSFRKILALIKKYIRYSKKKETEAELLIYYCKRLRTFCCTAFACDIAYDPDCARILCFEKFADSAAKSTSRITDSAAAIFVF